MKRILTIIVAAVLAVAMLTACGAKNVDLNKVMTDINDKYGLANLTPVENTDNLNRYYQIPADDVKNFAAELTKAATAGYTEVIMIEAKDADAAGRVKTQLESHRQKQLSDAKSYNASQVNMIESSAVKDNGNFVWLVIGEKQDDINTDIENAVK